MDFNISGFRVKLLNVTYRRWSMRSLIQVFIIAKTLLKNWDLKVSPACLQLRLCGNSGYFSVLSSTGHACKRIFGTCLHSVGFHSRTANLRVPRGKLFVISLFLPQIKIDRTWCNESGWRHTSVSWRNATWHFSWFFFLLDRLVHWLIWTIKPTEENFFLSCPSWPWWFDSVMKSFVLAECTDAFSVEHNFADSLEGCVFTFRNQNRQINWTKTSKEVASQKQAFSDLTISVMSFLKSLGH